MPKFMTRLRVFFSYLPDWILTIALIVASFLLDKIDGFRREFSLADTSIRFPFAVHERVPNFALYVIAVLAPAVLMPICNLLTIRSWWDLHSSWLGLAFTIATTGAVTEAVKLTVGRPRPDLLSRCQPGLGLVDPVFSLTTSSVCTQTNLGILQDGFRSFFSGHSSLSFAGLGFLSYYLAGKVHLFDKHGHTVKAWLALTPFLGALLVAISRTMDYRHHWQDVVVGSIVGTAFSFFGYRLYYPPLGSRNANRPHPPRTQHDADQEELPIHMAREGFNPSTLRLLEPHEMELLEAGHHQSR